MREDAATSIATSSPAGRVLGPMWGVAATVLGVLYTAVLALMAAVIAPFNQRWVDAIARLWGWLIVRTCGVRVVLEGVENLEREKGCVLIANHQSFFDIFALLALSPVEVRFVAKKELLKIPIFGYALKHSGHIVIDRARGHSIRRAVEVGRAGYCICVFAEGHRFNDNQVHKFNEGAAWLALQSKLACVPAAIIGSSSFFPRGAKVVVPGGRMRIRFGKPIETRELKSRDRAELTARLEEAVRGLYAELQGR